MKHTYAILGLGRFGLSLIGELTKFNCEVIGIDVNQEAVQKAAEMIEQAYIADSTSEKAMTDLGIQNVDHVIISYGSSLEATIMSFVTLKKIGVKKITVRCDKDEYVPVLEKIGCEDIVSPTDIAASRLAATIAIPDFTDYFELSGQYCVVNIHVNEDFKEKGLTEINPRNKFNCNILLIKREGKTISPKFDDVIKGGDEVYVLGANADIQKFISYLKND